MSKKNKISIKQHSLLDLDEEIFFEIVSFINIKEVINFILVNKKIYNICLFSKKGTTDYGIATLQYINHLTSLQLIKNPKNKFLLNNAIKNRIKIYKDFQYMGKINSKNLPNGKGIALFNNGNMYMGDWRNKFLHGFGKFVFKNGKILEGEFIRGYFNKSSKINQRNSQFKHYLYY